MRIEEMLKREDFFPMLEESVMNYYRVAKNQKVDFSYERRIGQKLIVNSKFGFVSPFPAPRGLRTFLLGEYNIRGNFLKFTLGRSAAFIASMLPQIGQCKTAYITEGVLGRNTFIYPQNRTIRFFDYDSMTVDCMVKAGFTDKYFKNHLNFRKKYHYDFLIPILDCGEDWFKEPILLGHPLARTTEEAVYEKGLREAVQGLRLLAEDTFRTMPARQYAAQLYENIEAGLTEAAERKHIRFAEESRLLARNALKVLQACRMDIPLCMSHGDFQSGNIWVDQVGKTWIYDWETAGVRSAWYDSTVLNYALRRSYGWADLLNAEEPAGMLSCDIKKERSQADYMAIKQIVLLEDILFYLEDMLELPEDWGAEIYDAFAERISGLFQIRGKGYGTA